MSLGCKSSWELAWSFKVEREVLIFHPLSTKFKPIHCLSRSPLRGGAALGGPASCGVLVWEIPPWVGPALSPVPQCSHQSRRSWPSGLRGRHWAHNWLLGSAPSLQSQFQCCLVSEDFFFLAPHQDISKEIFRTILYSVCLVVIRRVIHFIHFIYSGWRPSKNPVLYLTSEGPLQAEFPVSWRRPAFVPHLIGGGPPTLWTVICFTQI